MRSGGIDLSTVAKKTAVATITWRQADATLTSLSVGADDDALLEAIGQADKTGVDCPLGWPVAFVDYVSEHRSGGHDLVVPTTRAPLLLRSTDLHTIERAGVRPLSVSADRISATAMRAAALLSRLVSDGVAIDRSGAAGPIVEAYPAAALKIWGLPHRTYKGATPENVAVRAEIVEQLTAKMTWLDLGDHVTLCSTSDDALDAVVCAIVAGLSQRGLCEPVPDDVLDEARAEGWIALPFPDLALRPSSAPHPDHG